MKYLEINQAYTDYSGEVLMDNLKVGKDKTLRLKDLLIQYVGQFFESKDKAEVVRAFKVATKIQGCTIDKLPLEDAEFDLIKKAMDKPTFQPKGGPMLLAPIYLALEDAEKEAADLIVKTIAENTAEKEKVDVAAELDKAMAEGKAKAKREMDNG